MRGKLDASEQVRRALDAVDTAREALAKASTHPLAT
jgi:hypothetical protein